MFLLFEFKISRKAMEITRNINSFGPGTASEGTVQWWFQEFCKGDESLEDEEHSGWPSEVDNDQLRAIIIADPLTTTLDIVQELSINQSMVIWLLKQIGKVEKFSTNHCFEVSSSLILRNNNEPFFTQIVMCYKKRSL